MSRSVAQTINTNIEAKIPILLKPEGKDYLWGGTRLRTEYGKKINLDPLAETWECSVHPDGPSVVDSGEFRGVTLAEVLKEHPDWLGYKVTDGQFPILVKFIDAKKDLSVQVHPDDAYAGTHEPLVDNHPQNGKTEFWYVLEAEPGAKLVCGFSHNVNKDQLKNAIDTGTLEKHLQYVDVHRGDVFMIEAGTVHAIGAGIVLVEVQESSNLTYRLYDYNRVDPKSGKLRPLHFDKACDVLNMKASDAIRQKPRKVSYTPGSSREMLIRCSYFEAERIVSSMGFGFRVMDSSFQVLLCTAGYGGIMTDDMKRPLRFHKGDCVFVPAGAGRCHVVGETQLLKIRC